MIPARLERWGAAAGRGEQCPHARGVGRVEVLLSGV